MTDTHASFESEASPKSKREAWTRAGLLRLRRHLASLQAESHLLSSEAQASLKEVSRVLHDALSLDLLEGLPEAKPTWPTEGLSVLWTGSDARSVEPLLSGLAGERGFPRLTLVPDLKSALSQLQRGTHDLWVVSLSSDLELELLSGPLASLEHPPMVVVMPRTPNPSTATGWPAGLADVVQEQELSPQRLRDLAGRALARRRLLLDLSETQKRLEELVDRDPLTGLYNRRYFESRLATEFARAARFGEELSLVVIDVDHFKTVNDTFGHAVGDAVLVNTAELLLAGVRSIDLLARVGGEEFALLLPNTGSEGARGLVERIAERVRRHVFGDGTQPIQVTLSAGIGTTSQSGGARPALLFENADAALYQAKRRGRDRVEVFTPAAV